MHPVLDFQGLIHSHVPSNSHFVASNLWSSFWAFEDKFPIPLCPICWIKHGQYPFRVYLCSKKKTAMHSTWALIWPSIQHNNTGLQADKARIICVVWPVLLSNASLAGVPHMRQWTGSALVQIMACRLFGAEPLPEPRLTYCKLDP